MKSFQHNKHFGLFETLSFPKRLIEKDFSFWDSWVVGLESSFCWWALQHSGTEVGLFPFRFHRVRAVSERDCGILSWKVFLFVELKTLYASSC